MKNYLYLVRDSDAKSFERRKGGKMKNAAIPRTILIFALFGLLLSCTSFPSPKSGDDTLLILPVNTLRQTSVQFFGNCEVRIVRLEDYRETLYQIDPNSHYGMIEGLPPGQYAIREIAAKYKEGGTVWAKKADIEFSLIPNCITILPQEFFFKIIETPNKDKPGEYIYEMWVSWGDLTQSTAKKLLQRLIEEKNYPFWELSENTKENQAVSQAFSEL